jgi:hypothetical protein
MDWESDLWRGRYWLCRAGFGLLAVGLGLLCIYNVAFILQVFGLARRLGPIHRNPGWFWLVDAPIPWTTLIGSMCLWGLWRVPFWQSRVLPLILMNGADAACWLMDRAGALGLTTPEFARRHDWLMHLVTMGFGWLELFLTATLAASVSLHLGKESSQATGRSARALCTVGIAVWAVYALTQTDWLGWPLVRARIHPLTFLLILNTHVVLILASFQTALLCLAASRHCRQYVAAWSSYESSHDLLKSRSETAEELDLLRPARHRSPEAAQPNDSSTEGKRRA